MNAIVRPLARLRQRLVAPRMVFGRRSGAGAPRGVHSFGTYTRTGVLHGHPPPAGMQKEPLAPGAWSAIGSHGTIAPGARLGCGVLVKASSSFGGDVADFAVVGGQPVRVIGDMRELSYVYQSVCGRARRAGASGHRGVGSWGPAVIADRAPGQTRWAEWLS